MTTYLAYATAGKEFEVAEDIRDRGFYVWAPKKMEFLRRGHKRRPEVVVSPAIPNYLFLDLEAEAWHRMHDRPIKHLARTTYKLSRMDVLDLQAYRRRLDDKFREMEQVAAQGEAAMTEYKVGQRVYDIKRRFGDVCMKFKQMVEEYDKPYPMVAVEMEMFGQIVTAKLDPLDVKADE